jgi:glycosyltransferase involved in cell wall biosynthesis
MHELTYVIPAYNGARLIGRAIESILKQPGGHPNIIVVDDGSTDETENVVSTFKSEVTLLQQPNAGASASRNLGLHAVETEIVCFIDQDDYVIGPHHQEIEKSWTENVDMIVGLAAQGNDDYIHLSNRNNYGADATSYSLLCDFLCDYCVQTSTMSWSTRFLREIGGWDEALFGIEDIELAIRAFLRHARVAISNNPGWVVWHRHLDQASNKLDVRLVASQVYAHKKLIGLIEKFDPPRDILPLFLQRCMRLGRYLYLNGFRHEGIEVMSIAWNRGHTKHNGPLLENILANCLGTKATLSTRSFLARAKRYGVRAISPRKIL